jgi:outer membrane lipoprotein carrier protein
MFLLTGCSNIFTEGIEESNGMRRNWCMARIAVLLYPITVALCGLVTAPNAGAAAMDECIQGIEQQYAAMQDFSARFEQETTISSMQRTEKAEGTVCFKKGGKMYWEYKKPAVQKIYLDGKNLWFYLPEENQVMKNDTSRLPSDITADLFAGKLKIRDKFTVTRMQEPDQNTRNSIVIKLTPKTPHPNLKSLTLWLDCEKHYITRSTLEDEIGNRTVLKFSKFRANKGIPDTVFTFTPPAGVEIFEPPSLSSTAPSP